MVFKFWHSFLCFQIMFIYLITCYLVLTLLLFTQYICCYLFLYLYSDSWNPSRCWLAVLAQFCGFHDDLQSGVLERWQTLQQWGIVWSYWLLRLPLLVTYRCYLKRRRIKFTPPQPPPPSTNPCLSLQNLLNIMLCTYSICTYSIGLYAVIHYKQIVLVGFDYDYCEQYWDSQHN